MDRAPPPQHRQACHSQQERTACMLIARLHDVGADLDEDDTTIHGRLDLTECKRTTPTDILKWARKEQGHLFPHLAPNGAKTAAKVSDRNRRELARVLKRVLREVDDLPEPLRAAIKAAHRCMVIARLALRYCYLRPLPLPTHAPPTRHLLEFPFLIACEAGGTQHAYYLSRIGRDGVAVYLTPARQVPTITLSGNAKQVGGDVQSTCSGKNLLEQLRSTGQAYYLQPRSSLSGVGKDRHSVMIPIDLGWAMSVHGT